MIDFISFLKDSNLPPADKDVWTEAIGLLTPEGIKILSDFVASDEGRLRSLTEDIKTKKQAIDNLNYGKIESIITKS